MLVPRFLRIEFWLFGGLLGERVLFGGKNALGSVGRRCGGRSVMGQSGVKEAVLAEPREVGLLVFGPG